MLQAFRNRLKDVQTIKRLCLEAERQARLSGYRHPGAEHYLLAAFALDDGTARATFARLNADPQALGPAILAHHLGALASLGIDASRVPPPPEQGPAPILFEAAESGKAVVQALAGLRRATASPRLLGAHVLLAVAAMQNSTAARSLRSLRIDLREMARAASDEISLRSGALES